MKYAIMLGLIVVGLIAVWFSIPVSPTAAQDDPPAVTKLFEETSYYLKDLTFVDANVGWAVGDVHWDQTRRDYTGTIIKTSDGGVTWTPQAVGVTELFNAVVFVDATTGWVVGTSGSIVHTTDGGQTWSQQAVDTTDEFRDVVFMDASNGWAVATIPTTYNDFLEEYTDWNASIWHTNDGGQTWQQQAIPDTASILHGVDFVDAQAGWAVGAKRAGEDAFGDTQHAGVIYHTADGGQTWTEQYSPEAITLTAVDFVDGLYGWAVGFPTNSGGDQRAVFHTSDGGQSWERQEPGNIYAPLWDVQFVDQNRGYIVGADYVGAWGPPVFRTFDGGATWESVKMDKANPLTTEGLYAVAVVDDRVIAVGDHDYVATTTQAWDSPERDASGMPCYNLSCLFEQHYLNSHYIFHAVFFADEKQGWVVGSQTFAVSHWGQVILHTQDGGQTWETQYEHAPDVEGLFSIHRLADVQFIDDQNGWAVGSSVFHDNGFYGAILRTSDGGLSWQDSAAPLYRHPSEETGRDREFFAVDFADGQSGWALASSYFPSPNVHLAHTSDGGTNWELIDTGIEGPLAIGFAHVQGDVDFPDTQHGWAVGGLGTIVHTADGGATWTLQALNCGYEHCPWALFAVEMIDAQTGWIAGEGLYHTTDGGVTWSPQETAIPGYIHAIQFPDAQHGWLTGDGGTLRRTTNGGTTWQAVETGEGVPLYGLHFINPDQGWIVGDAGVILMYGTGGASASTPPETPAVEPEVGTRTCTITASGTTMLYPEPSMTSSGTPILVNTGTELVLDGWTTDESGMIWYHTVEETWAVREMLFLGAAPPAECAALPELGPTTAEPPPTLTPEPALPADEPSSDVRVCTVTVTADDAIVLFPQPSLDSFAMPSMAMPGTQLVFDGQFTGAEGVWYRTVNGQWVLSALLFLGAAPPAECADLAQVTP